MLFYLFRFLHDTFDIPGAGMWSYISFRSLLALILSLIIFPRHRSFDISIGHICCFWRILHQVHEATQYQ